MAKYTKKINPVKNKNSLLLRCDNKYHTDKGMTLTWQQALIQIISLSTYLVCWDNHPVPELGHYINYSWHVIFSKIYLDINIKPCCQIMDNASISMDRKTKIHQRVQICHEIKKSQNKKNHDTTIKVTVNLSCTETRLFQEKLVNTTKLQNVFCEMFALLF